MTFSLVLESNMKKILCLFALAFVLSSCSDGEGTTKLLEEQGYSNIVIKGYDGWSCHDDDHFSTEFEATGPTGKQVHGTVCLDLKGSYIRFH